VSYIVRGTSPAARDRLDSLKINDVGCISVVTEAEIRYGLARKPPSLAFRTISMTPGKDTILPWSSDEAQAYGTFGSNWNVPARPLAPWIC